MKKLAILALSALMITGMFTGCRKNVGTETTAGTSHSTTEHTTHPTTRPTEATRHTEPSHETHKPSMPTDMMPGDSTGSTESSGAQRHMRPRY